MGVIIELSELEAPRFLSPPEFSVPFATPSLRWGCKKRLRCFNPAAAGSRFSPSSSPEHVRSGSTVSPSSTREPLPASPLHRRVGGAPSPSVSLQVSSVRPIVPTRLAYSPEDKAEGPSVPPTAESPDLFSGVPVHAVGAGVEESRPWTLRSRVRAAGGIEEGKKKRKKVELWVSLSRDEIEEDFMWMTGAKPPRRSRRRSNFSSDLLQGLFPGLWLPTKITKERYKVSETSDCKKV